MLFHVNDHSKGKKKRRYDSLAIGLGNEANVEACLTLLKNLLPSRDEEYINMSKTNKYTMVKISYTISRGKYVLHNNIVNI